MTNVLITAIGSFSAEAVVTLLKSIDCKVTGCDIYPKEWHYLVKKLDNFYQVPLAVNEKEYIEKILEICKLEKIDFIFPLTDVEVDIFNNNRKIFKKLKVKVCIQSEKHSNFQR